ncbi:MAG: hypothetical protein U0Q16_20260 [Bryobacteraceae bacterium]
MRFRPWQVCLALAVLCFGAIGVMEWMRSRRDISDQALLLRLPAQEDGVHLFADVQKLRQAGFLDMIAGSPAAEETDYREFVKATGFDYRQDLDAIVGSFRFDKTCFLLRGRFQWDQIRQYGISKGASCLNGYCESETSTPGRWISFFMIAPTVLAVAFSDSGGGAAAAMALRPVPPDFFIPEQPLWIRLPKRVLTNTDSMRPGTRAFFTAVKDAQRVTLGIGSNQEKLEVEMLAQFASQADADKTLKQLGDMTDLLKKMIAREKAKPSPTDLSGILTAGRFERNGTRVVGRWPVERDFLESIAKGSM